MIKVKYASEIHLIKLARSLKDIKAKTREVFKQLPNSFHFVYLDEDGDEIQVDCQADMEAVMQEHEENRRNVLKLEVKQSIECLRVEEEMDQCEDMGVEEESSIQVLEEREVSDYESLNCDEEQTQLLHSIEYCEEEQSVQVSRLVTEHLIGLEESLVERVIGVQMEVQAVNTYLERLYEEIQEQSAEKQIQQSIDESLQDEEEPIEAIVSRSLKKLLPQFIEDLTSQTIKSVKELMTAHKNLI